MMGVKESVMESIDSCSKLGWSDEKRQKAFEVFLEFGIEEDYLRKKLYKEQ